MSDNDRNTYVFEDIQPKDVRIGARIKPQYRNILDIIARDRRTNISEVLELAIHKLAETYMIEDQCALDFVGYSTDILEQLFLGLRFNPLPPEQNIMQKEYYDIRKKIMSYLPDGSMPTSLYSPQERYADVVLSDPKIQYDAWYSITPMSLLYFVFKAWHIGQSVEDSIEILHYADRFTRDVLWKKYTSDTSEETLRKNIEEDSNIFFKGIESLKNSAPKK